MCSLPWPLVNVLGGKNPSKTKEEGALLAPPFYPMWAPKLLTWPRVNHPLPFSSVFAYPPWGL